MTSRERVYAILDRKGDGSGAMWTGHPNHKTVPIFAEKWGIEPTYEAIFTYLNDDCRWISADGGYHHPERRPALDPGYGIDRANTLGAAGCFANAETVEEIEKYPWPDPKYCDFTDTYKAIERFPDKMVFTGMWSPFFHNLCDFFGMENYFCMMYEYPEVVECATEHITDWYLQSNELFLQGLGDRSDVIFFGNDVGTQRALFMDPEMFRKFVLPSIRKIVALGKKYNKKVIMHSCGSIAAVIPDLIEAGVDCLHPIQAQAAGMDAKSLSQYKNDIAFLGGIDAQSFFVNATPQQIKDEVHRVRDILGPNLIVSPSHEEILPNVPAENIYAMMEAARD